MRARSGARATPASTAPLRRSGGRREGEPPGQRADPHQADAALLHDVAGDRRPSRRAEPRMAAAERRVACERQLAARREDAHPVVGRRAVGAQQERGLAEVRPARERLHLRRRRARRRRAPRRAGCRAAGVSVKTSTWVKSKRVIAQLLRAAPRPARDAAVDLRRRAVTNDRRSVFGAPRRRRTPRPERTRRRARRRAPATPRRRRGRQLEPEEHAPARRVPAAGAGRPDAPRAPRPSRRGSAGSAPAAPAGARAACRSAARRARCAG